MTCSVEGCGRKASSRGWCKRHYERWRVHGNPLHQTPAFYGRSQVREELSAKLSRKSALTDSGCLQWIGRVENKRGYGQVAVDGEMRKAHRVSWEVYHGRPVPDGPVVRHSCDNPPCIHPEHLISGTQLANVADMFGRQRQSDRVGTANGSAKLTPEQVLSIRAQYDTGSPVAALAQRFNISKSQVRNIIANTHWRHVS